MKTGLRLQGIIGLAMSVALLGGCISSSGEEQDDDVAFDRSGEEIVRAARDPIAGDLAVKLDSVALSYSAEARLTVKVRFTNNAAYPVRMLAWNVLAEKIDDDLFAVTREGEPVDYTGRHYRRREPKWSDHVTLAPGHSVTRLVDLTDAYNFTQDGTYHIRYATEIGRGSEVEAVALESNELSVHVDGRPNAVLEQVASEQSALTTPSCTASRTTIIKKAIADAKTMTADSVAYLSGNPSNKARYTTWFGAYNATRWNTTKKNFGAIQTALKSPNIQVMCDCPDNAYWAWVYPDQPYKIHVCGAFWATDTNYQDDRATTMIHEMSHFNTVASTDDVVYGRSGSQSLAKTNPAKAVTNADTYSYFAEND